MLSLDREAFIRSVRSTYKFIKPHIQKTPILRSKSSYQTSSNIYLKCENLQYTNSFKFRGALSAILHYQYNEKYLWRYILKYGLVTGSTGNFAQALAQISHTYGFLLTVIIHDQAETSKIDNILFYNRNTKIIIVPLQKWQSIMISGKYSDEPGLFLSSEMNDYVTWGNATLGLEVLHEISSVDAVLIPYGGGNLTYSIASYLKAIKKEIKIYTVEVSTGAPFAASFKAHTPIEVPYSTSFIDGIGASFVIPEQFSRVKPLITDALVVTPVEVAESLTYLLLHDKIVVEGAGSATLAACLKYGLTYNHKNICCILSGGNINKVILTDLLHSNHQKFQHGKNELSYA